MRKSILILFLLFSFVKINAQFCDQLDAGPDVTVDCNNNCTSLHAQTAPGLGMDTDTYIVQQDLPCPLPPEGNITPTTINTDDIWSSAITLPFTFYFFGQPYNYIIVGANGVVSFDLNRTTPQNQTPNGYCEWQFNEQLPDTNLFRNTIFGAYHDVDVRYGGTIKYYVSGQAPQRKFVIAYDNVAHFSCNDLHTTQRVVLYENTNVIDVQIDYKDTCSSWNNGNAVIGIQNEAGTVAYVPPGRNTGQWTVTTPELWKFIPNTPPAQGISVNYEWYNTTDNSLVGTGDTINVCVTETTTFRVEATYVNVYGQNVTLTDEVTVNFDDILGNVDLGPDIDECNSPTVTIDGTTTNATSYQWAKDGVDLPGETNPIITVSDSGTYSLTVETGACSHTDDIVVRIEPTPIVDLGADFHFCEGTTQTITANVSNLSGNETYQWYKDGVELTGETYPTLNINDSGTYRVDISNTIGCIGSDEVVATMDPYPQLDLGPDLVLCYDQTAEIQSNITDADNYAWEVNGNPDPNNTDMLSLSGPGEYDVVLTIDRGTCNVSDEVHITILEPVNATLTPIFYGELEIDASGGLPPYQYSVDGINYQENNHFTDLPDNDYTVYIIDSNGCEYILPPVHVTNLIFYSFFTPNGDGYNDVWRIGNSENTPDATVYIYDRFGRTLKVMHTRTTDYWDGKVKGREMLSSDYWYMLVLQNGKTYKGHFTLKR